MTKLFAGGHQQLNKAAVGYDVHLPHKHNVVPHIVADIIDELLSAGQLDIVDRLVLFYACDSKETGTFCKIVIIKQSSLSAL